MGKIVTLGEIMLRLSPEGNDRFLQTDHFRIIPRGGEANVAVSLANYGHEAVFMTKLPQHEIGQIAVNALRRYGVDTRFIVRGGDRAGLYYAETGASMRPLMQYVDVCIGNEEDAQLCLGFKSDADVEGGKTDASGYHKIFEQMAKQFGFKYVVSTLRESYSATHNGWKALIYNGQEFYESRHYDIDPIIDRVGGGDSFAGGLIHGLLTKVFPGDWAYITNLCRDCIDFIQTVKK